jgi:hypothetical protein
MVEMLGASVQVGGVDTVMHVAAVADDTVRRNGANVQLIGKTVNQSHTPGTVLHVSYHQKSISPVVLVSVPQPTGIGLPHVFPKPFFGRLPSSRINPTWHKRLLLICQNLVIPSGNAIISEEAA